MPRQALHLSVWSSLVSMIALIPVLVGTLGIVAPVAYGLHLIWPTWGAVIPFALWWAPAPLLLVPANQRLIARVCYGCREPVGAERNRLEQPWRALQHRAGIPGGRFQLMVMASDELNACVVTGRIVVVTSRSAASPPPDRLEAVLAHELGHRLGRPAVLVYVSVQLMLPIQALRWLLRAVWRPVGPMWRRAVAWHRPIGFLVTFVLALFATAVTVVAGLPAAVAFGGVALARLATGRAELRADSVAVRLGLGPQLLTVVEQLIETGGHGRDELPRAERLLALPPLLVRRAQWLRTSLAVQQARSR
jgi:Zn-dependent protease with chaperone function